mmetsp:Transcript_32538/g.68747  ORF Transcript_32538/g.68747 Transcript_32538/m.68747 type:complete len:221 (-) Transcript_32538:94-756(-)
MHDQIILTTLRKRFVMLLQIRPSALAPRPDRRGVALVHIPARTGLIHVRTVLIKARQQQSHPVRPPDVRLRRPLMPIGQICGEASGGHGRAVDVLVIEALVAHPFGEGAGVGGEAGDADAEVIVDFEDFLLVRGEFGDGALEGADDGVGGGAEGDAGGALFDGFHGVFHLKETALGRPNRHIRIIHITKHGANLLLLNSQRNNLPNKERQMIQREERIST